MLCWTCCVSLCTYFLHITHPCSPKCTLGLWGCRYIGATVNTRLSWVPSGLCQQQTTAPATAAAGCERPSLLPCNLTITLSTQRCQERGEAETFPRWVRAKCTKLLKKRVSAWGRRGQRLCADLIKTHGLRRNCIWRGDFSKVLILELGGRGLQQECFAFVRSLKSWLFREGVVRARPGSGAAGRSPPLLSASAAQGWCGPACAAPRALTRARPCVSPLFPLQRPAAPPARRGWGPPGGAAARPRGRWRSPAALWAPSPRRHRHLGRGRGAGRDSCSTLLPGAAGATRDGEKPLGNSAGADLPGERHRPCRGRRRRWLGTGGDPGVAHGGPLGG